MAKVFRKFEALDKNTNTKHQYVIQEIPEDRFPDVVEFMVKYFITEEAMCECKKVAEDPEGVEFCKGFSMEMLAQKSSLMCLEEGSGEIVAANLLIVQTQDEIDSLMEMIPDSFADQVAVAKIIENEFDSYKNFNVDRILKCYGMAVHPDHRGRGIATELFKAREEFLKHLGLEVTIAECTGIGSQIAAERAGYDCHLTLEYAKLHEYQPGLYFDGIKHKYLKLMSFRIKSDS